MSFWNGYMNYLNFQKITKAIQGPQGLPGVGFKLTHSGDYDMQNKKLVNVDTDEAHRLSAVNTITLNNKVGSRHEKDKDIDLQDKYNVKNSKEQSFTDLAANYDNLVSYADVKNIFLSRKETFPMETALDMGNHTIFNVKDPTVADQGANKRYVDNLHSHSLLTDGTNYPKAHMNWNSKRIENLLDPVGNQDAATKKYEDAETAKNRLEINRVEFDSNADVLVSQNQIKTKADKTWVDSAFYKTGKQLDMGEPIYELFLCRFLQFFYKMKIKNNDIF